MDNLKNISNSGLQKAEEKWKAKLAYMFPWSGKGGGGGVVGGGEIF